ncbi:uncharacterized protein LOC121810028 [Salvia splendens]|uniref:uncharacterized protein LOC121810028 n=1 Tax=Salvia splendens TaxID=180675 RepID=UPI001C266400|nr:uncharacterized protein LOC121810028 [Salvia splendens]
MQGKRKARSFSPSPSSPLIVPIEYSDGEASCPDATPAAKKLRSDGLSGCVTLQDLKDRFQLVLDRDAAAAEADTESDVYAPLYFPWKMTSESWEACKAEAVRQRKDEGFFGFNSPDDDELIPLRRLRKCNIGRS